MNGDVDAIAKLKRNQASFRVHMSELWERKHNLLNLFRTRMEQEKLNEIKAHLTRMSQPNDSLPPNRHF